MEIIVKEDWLPPLPLAKRVRERTQSLLLRGQLADPADHPFLRTLGNEAKFFLREKAAQIAGQPGALLQLDSAWQDDSPSAEEERLLWEERAFLRGFAHSRLGREVEADFYFARLPFRFHAMIRSERALLRLNRGELREAEGMFVESATASVPFDPYSAATLLGGLTLARIQQGNFLGAEQALRERRRILRFHPSPPLGFGTRLYEMLFSLERNAFDDAAAALERTMSAVAPASVNGFFVRHLELRLLLARHQLADAAKSLRGLNDLRRQLGFPEGVLDLRLEEIEFHLRQKNPAATDAAIRALKPATEKDQYLRFRLGVLEAQALNQTGRTQEAFAVIQSAVELGEARHYRPGLSMAFLHAAGIALAAGHSLAARLYLSRGRALAAQLHLPVRLAGFSYLTDVLEARGNSGHALIALARHQEIGPELEYFLGAYGLLNEVRLTVSSGAGREVVAEANLRRRLFRAAGLFWFQREAVLLVNRGEGRVLTYDFPEGAAFSALFRLLWSEREQGSAGLTLREVHATRSPAPFREHLHAGAAKMLITRLRQRLSGSGLELRYDRPAGRYFLASDLGTYSILSGATAAGGKAPARDRKAEILARIAMESYVTTQALGAELGVSRQALHVFLKQLLAEGRIRLVRRGPKSGYVFVG